MSKFCNHKLLLRSWQTVYITSKKWTLFVLGVNVEERDFAEISEYLDYSTSHSRRVICVAVVSGVAYQRRCRCVLVEASELDPLGPLCHGNVGVRSQLYPPLVRHCLSNEWQTERHKRLSAARWQVSLPRRRFWSHHWLLQAYVMAVTARRFVSCLLNFVEVTAKLADLPVTVSAGNVNV